MYGFRSQGAHGVDPLSAASKAGPKFPAWLKARIIAPSTFATLSTVFADYLDGHLQIDEYITHQRKLEDLAEGFNDMHVRLFIRLELSSASQSA